MTEPHDDFRHRQVTIGESRFHVVEAGPADAPPFVFLHGWPQSSYAWRRVMRLAAGQVRAVAIDLPGIGGSTGAPAGGAKTDVAAVVHGLLAALDLRNVTLVGHDIGGMVTYAYLRAFPDLARAVILNVPIPGVDPWERFIREPFLWHFAFHTVAGLPEQMVAGREEPYFDYFYDLLATDPARITAEARRDYVTAYRSPGALEAGFTWYRAFARDSADNQAAAAGQPVDTPLLYLRGERERGGAVESYVQGLRDAGVRQVQSGIVPGAGHYGPEENPADTWRLISDFAFAGPDQP